MRNFCIQQEKDEEMEKTRNREGDPSIFDLYVDLFLLVFSYLDDDIDVLKLAYVNKLFFNMLESSHVNDSIYCFFKNRIVEKCHFSEEFESRILGKDYGDYCRLINEGKCKSLRTGLLLLHYHFMYDDGKFEKSLSTQRDGFTRDYVFLEDMNTLLRVVSDNKKWKEDPTYLPSIIPIDQYTFQPSSSSSIPPIARQALLKRNVVVYQFDSDHIVMLQLDFKGEYLGRREKPKLKIVHHMSFQLVENEITLETCMFAIHVVGGLSHKCSKLNPTTIGLVHHKDETVFFRWVSVKKDHQKIQEIQISRKDAKEESIGKPISYNDSQCLVATRVPLNIDPDDHDDRDLKTNIYSVDLEKKKVELFKISVCGYCSEILSVPNLTRQKETVHLVMMMNGYDGGSQVEYSICEYSITKRCVVRSFTIPDLFKSFVSVPASSVSHDCGLNSLDFSLLPNRCVLSKVHHTFHGNIYIRRYGILHLWENPHRIDITLGETYDALHDEHKCIVLNDGRILMFGMDNEKMFLLKTPNEKENMKKREHPKSSESCYVFDISYNDGRVRDYLNQLKTNFERENREL